MRRAYYASSIESFLSSSRDDVLGQMARHSSFDITQTQRDAWLAQIDVLQAALPGLQGRIYFEYSIPRMGRRIDAVLIVGPIIFVLEFKVGETTYPLHAIEQVWDYALDLKNFHEGSHAHYICPILIATEASASGLLLSTIRPDLVWQPISCNPELLRRRLDFVVNFSEGAKVDTDTWEASRYSPTPTIVEAAMALYRGHSVTEISRSDAGAFNLARSSETLTSIIEESKNRSQKAICFLTGVPGAGKTLVGLNIATQHMDKESELYSVFLSGNGPLVAILREALTRDKVRFEKERGAKLKKGEAMSQVKAFIQNVHNFRDECLIDMTRPPIEHVALFDEAQRAWDLAQTSNFMLRKKGKADFNQSEPEYLISCMDRHPDWAVIVCLVGGGQEINVGESGIGEWITALKRSFPEWHIYMSSQLHDSEYGAGLILEDACKNLKVSIKDELHLSSSMRSFRSEKVSLLVKQLLDLDALSARDTLNEVNERYPIAITRDLASAKAWLKEKARGSERYGIVVSSKAERLKPHSIDIRSPMDPIHWFLDGKEDVRSSYYLEDVATEFHVQGLELDWSCVVWDADLRFTPNGWDHRAFVGHKWNMVNKLERKRYLKNAYRVLLTRARQGMVIVVPLGDTDDPTRKPEFYDPIYSYLEEIGFAAI
jgi:DUF2075 family protein